MCPSESVIVVAILDGLSVAGADCFDRRIRRRVNEGTSIIRRYADDLEEIDRIFEAPRLAARAGWWGGNIRRKFHDTLPVSVQRLARQECAKRHDHCCAVCGKRGRHVHHIIPRGLGGGWEQFNLLLVCFKCHCAIHQPRISLERFSKEARRRIIYYRHKIELAVIACPHEKLRERWRFCIGPAAA